MSNNLGFPTDPNRRIFAIFGMSVDHCSPNSDPNGGGPRTDEDGHGLMSPHCLKRTPRDYWADVKSLQLHIARGTDLAATRKSYEERVGDIEDKRKAGEAVRAAMLSDLIDLRVFGGLIGGKGRPVRPVHGAVQFGWARSVDPIEVVDYAVTRVAIGAEDESKPDALRANMGNASMVEHAVYAGTLSYNPFSRVRGNVPISSADLGAFWEAFVEGWEYMRSTMRSGVALRDLLVWDYPTTVGAIRQAVLADRLVFEQNGGTAYRSYNKRVVDGPLSPGMRCIHWHDGEIALVGQA